MKHHERLDRSGYCQGLMEEALLKAKILALADALEAYLFGQK